MTHSLSLSLCLSVSLCLSLSLSLSLSVHLLSRVERVLNSVASLHHVGPPANPEAVVLRRNNCGTRGSSHALPAFNGGIRGAYTDQSLSSIYGEVRHESLCGVRLAAGSVRLEEVGRGTRISAVPERERIVARRYCRYSPFRVAPLSSRSILSDRRPRLSRIVVVVPQSLASSPFTEILLDNSEGGTGQVIPRWQDRDDNHKRSVGPDACSASSIR